MSGISVNPKVDDGGEWNSSWAGLQGNMVQLYTRSNPRTIHEFWQRCYFEDLWACMGPDAAKAKYLELGAGRGTTSMYLSSRGCDVTMVDLSASGFEVARANFARERITAPAMVQADARSTGLVSESFDCVFSIGLLEHFADPRPLLIESLRLLRPGGFHFGVIVPERPASIKYLTHALFRPWMLAYELLPESARAQFRKWRGRPVPESREKKVMRTGYSRSDYLQMVADLDVVEARCVPYNPYHSAYNSAFWEAALAIPLYRLHRACKKLYSKASYTSTMASAASCDLLTFRKR